MCNLLYLDCDQDSIVVNVKQVGPACHTGEDMFSLSNYIGDTYGKCL